VPEDQPTGTILVVSDDPRLEDHMRSGLPAGLEVVSEGDAREAIARLAELTPRAVVVDLQTGSAGGYGLARDMSQTLRLASIPVVVLIERDQDRWLAQQAGAAVTLTKPVTGAQLWMAVSSLLPA
jgi:DNA-binding response OmpR family regulator